MAVEIHNDIELIDSDNTLTINNNGTISTDANDLVLQADAGNVTIDSVGAGNYVTITSADDITLDATGSNSSLININGAGGSGITISTADSAAIGGGFIKLITGDNSDTIDCDDISILGGSNSSAVSGDGADITITAGDSEAGNAGAISISTGSGTAGDIAAGNLTLATGASSGSGTADVILKASNGGAAATYLTCDGSAENITMAKPLLCSSTAEFDAQVDFDADVDFNSTSSSSGTHTITTGGSTVYNSGATIDLEAGATATCSTTLTIDADGRLIFTQKTLEGSPTQGEVCQDTLHDTLAYYNGSFWQNAGGLVFNQVAQSDAWSTGNNIYGIFEESSTDISYTIPANSLRVGNIIRVKGYFSLNKGGSDTYGFVKLQIGTTGVTATDEDIGLVLMKDGDGTAASGDAIASFEGDIVVRSLGAGGSLLPQGVSVSKVTSEDPVVETFNYDNTATKPIDTTEDNYIYCAGALSVTASNDLLLEYFSVEII